MESRILLTGATSGIGMATAMALSEIPGVHLILVTRNAKKGRRVEKLLKGNCSIDLRICDISSKGQVRDLSSKLIGTYPTVETIINNAGARYDKYQKSEDGIELTFATNHLGHFLLTKQLIEELAKSPKRIINVSSSAHRHAQPELGWNLSEYNYDRKIAYANSKLANILFTKELTSRVNISSSLCVAVDPGPTGTGFARNNGLVAWMRHLLWHKMKGELQTAAQGAETVVWLATHSIDNQLNGKLFQDREAIEPIELANDSGLGAQLWSLSCTLTDREFQS